MKYKSGYRYVSQEAVMVVRKLILKF